MFSFQSLPVILGQLVFLGRAIVRSNCGLLYRRLLKNEALSLIKRNLLPADPLIVCQQVQPFVNSKMGIVSNPCRLCRVRFNFQIRRWSKIFKYHHFTVPCWLVTLSFLDCVTRQKSVPKRLVWSILSTILIQKCPSRNVCTISYIIHWIIIFKQQ